MDVIPVLKPGQVEAIAKLLGECGTGGDIDRSFSNCQLRDASSESTKWRRIDAVFAATQRSDGNANRALTFISDFLTPARFVGRSEQFEANRKELNAVLAFSGLEYGKNGKFVRTDIAETLDQAEARLRTLQEKFRGRHIHPEVYKYCRAELLQDNYFHAVFEAVKGLAQRIRDLSGSTSDGDALIAEVFSIERPRLAFNTLRTETERSEHKGIAQLLKGCFAAVRNPLAHGPKILWQGEDDAADYFTLISLLHRKLDDCVPLTN